MTEYKRKLASVQITDDILPHDNADSLELAVVMGWQVIIKKNEFKKGDKIIYLEIDSVCPDQPWSQFLKAKDFRIRTIKLRGKMSQGLILPMTTLEQMYPGSSITDHKVGDDVTDLLKITKYEAPEERHSHVQGTSRVFTFPAHYGFTKTDEPRLQSMLTYLEMFKGLPWYATVKYDGMSGTYFIDPETKKLAVCSRNQRIEKPDELKGGDYHWKIAEKYKLEEILSKYDHLVIQGEVYGPSIQDNKLNVKELKFAIFTIYDLNKKKYCLYEDLKSYCQKMGLEMVTVDSEGNDFNFTKNELLEKVRGKYPGSKHDREGLVFRLKETHEINGERASFKVINNDFLLKEK